jgi:hypothetical protein
MIIDSPIISGSLIVTGSAAFTGSLTLSGSMNTVGTITATTLVVQTITSSISSITGSTSFGSSSINNHNFTGSLIVSGAMFVSSSGNVGIGTLVPTNKLDVVNAGVNAIRVQNTLNTSDAYLIAQNTLGSTFFGINATGGYIYNLATLPILFYTSGSERMRITATGSVGIGTTSPSYTLSFGGDAATTIGMNQSILGTAPALTLRGADSTTGTNNEGGPIFISSGLGTGNGATSNIIFSTGAPGGSGATRQTLTERMRITAAGNVGIGTTSPSYKLHIIESTTNGRAVQGVATATSGTNYGAVLVAEGIGATKNIGLYASAEGATTNVAAIFDKGNVGIGTSSPTVSQTGGGLALGDGTAQKGIRFNVESGGWGYIEYYEASTAKWITGFRSADGSYNIKTGTNLSTGNGISIANTGITTINNTLVLGTSGFVGNIQYGTSGYGTHDYNAGNGKFTWLSGAGAVSGTVYYSFNADGSGARFTIANNGAATLVGALTQNTSDKRLKDNVKNIDNALNKVMALNGVTFDWNDIAVEYGWSPRIKNNDIGVLAQEVQAVLPQAIDFAPFDRDDNQQSKSGENYLTVQYEKIVPLLIESIKELNTKLDAATAEIEALKAK